MAERGPLESEINTMMWDAFHSDPDVLQAQLEERGYSVEEALMINARTDGVHRRCLLRIAREIDNLARRE
jgi:hypothetical protein